MFGGREADWRLDSEIARQKFEEERREEHV